ncbi:sialidase [candidate division KSB1 bacterium]|nr:sialidase [candidate division KSB1 bacterium]
MLSKKLGFLFIMAMSIIACDSGQQAGKNMQESTHAAIDLEEFIYSEAEAPTPECHASTIVALEDRLVAAWFGGTKEKNKNVVIWFSMKQGQDWSPPVEVANGVQDDGTRHPTWNPVLFQPRQGPLMLFYKVGPDPRSWWGMVIESTDGGESWSEPRRLPDGILGPIKNKPIQLANGDIVSPTSTEHDGWEVQIERSTDGGDTWTSTGSLNDGDKIGAIQPAILNHGNGTLQLLCRTENEVISECWSQDYGKTWSEMTATDLPNPNSGIDALTLDDGRHVLIYNPTNENWGDRVPLSVAISADGKSWERLFDLEPVTNPETTDEEEYSYPGVVQAPNGLVHIVYTYNRKTVKHVVLDPQKL